MRETQTSEKGIGPLVELGGSCGAGNQTSEWVTSRWLLLLSRTLLSGGTWRWASVGGLGSIAFARVMLTETENQMKKK